MSRGHYAIQIEQKIIDSFIEQEVPVAVGMTALAMVLAKQWVGDGRSLTDFILFMVSVYKLAEEEG